MIFLKQKHPEVDNIFAAEFAMVVVKMILSYWVLVTFQGKTVKLRGGHTLGNSAANEPFKSWSFGERWFFLFQTGEHLRLQTVIMLSRAAARYILDLPPTQFSSGIFPFRVRLGFPSQQSRNSWKMLLDVIYWKDSPLTMRCFFNTTSQVSHHPL